MWVISLLGLLLLIFLVNAIKFEWDHSEPDPLAQSGQSESQRRDRTRRMLVQGGPQTLEEYLEIFPAACPRCGGRYLYESLIPRRSFITPLLRNRRPKRSWMCTRCGHSNLSQKPVKPLQNLRFVPSPYLSAEQSLAIPELAVELTEVILLRVINQLQNLIRNGEASDWLLRTGQQRQYIDINDINELEVISQRTLTVIINQVLPQIKPELDGVVNQSVQKAMGMAPGYRSFQQIPGIGRVPEQMTQHLVAEVSQNLYQALQKSLASSHDDPAMKALLAKFAATLRREIQQDNTLAELEAMTLALLEEIKINYVKRLSQEDYGMLLEQRFRLYDVTQERGK